MLAGPTRRQPSTAGGWSRNKSPGRHLALVASTSAAGLDYEGNAIGNKRVLVGFQLHGKGCIEDAECFEHRARVLEFGAVNTSFPNCPQGCSKGISNPSGRSSSAGTAASRQARGASTGEDISFGGRFVHEGRLARGWFRVDEEGCTTERVHWKARLK